MVIFDFMHFMSIIVTYTMMPDLVEYKIVNDQNVISSKIIVTLPIVVMNCIFLYVLISLNILKLKITYGQNFC